MKERSRTEEPHTHEESTIGEDTFRNLAEAANVGVYLIQDGLFKYSNAHFAEMTGYGADEITGGLAPQDIIFPEDYKNFAQENIRKRLSGEIESIHYEVKLITKNGRILQTETHGSRTTYQGRPAVIGTILDITERKNAEAELLRHREHLEESVKERTAALEMINLQCRKEIEEHKRTQEALRASEERYRTIFENAVLGIFQTSPEGLFIRVNPAFAHIHGYSSPEEMIDATTDIAHQHYVDPEDRVRFKRLLEDHDIVKLFEAMYRRKDGSTIWLVLNARCVRDSRGRILYYEGTVEDVTDRRKTEDALRESEEQQKSLESQVRQSQKMDAIGQLAGGIAHDFSNILTVIIGFGNIVKNRMQGDDPLRFYVEQILSSSQRAANLTKGLLAFSRKQVMELKPHNLNMIIEGVEELLQRLLTEDIGFALNLGAEAMTVMADVTQMEQVLMNLVANARDAMPRGGRIRITTGVTELSRRFIKSHGYGKAGKYALISVADTGCGMDEKTREQIFEPFFTTKDMGKGTGLGLSIAYGIVTQHDGHIAVASKPGKGTTFSIYLPLVFTEAEEAKQISPRVAGGTETVLVAEDDQEVRYLTREVLAEAGYTVLEARDGNEAVQIFRDQKHRISLLLFDVVMPGKNGTQAYEEIKEMDPEVKVIFTSGYTGDVVLQKGLCGEAVNFVPKPIRPNDLLTIVRTVLDG